MGNNQTKALAGTPLAFFITVTTYGTWLSGDERGWNVQTSKRPPRGMRHGQNRLQTWVAGRMKRTPLVLTPEMRDRVEGSVRDACDKADWTLLALAVLSNHLHALVASGVTAGQTLSRLKGCATRACGAPDASGLISRFGPGRVQRGTSGRAALWRRRSTTSRRCRRILRP